MVTLTLPAGSLRTKQTHPEIRSRGRSAARNLAGNIARRGSVQTPRAELQRMCGCGWVPFAGEGCVMSQERKHDRKLTRRKFIERSGTIGAGIAFAPFVLDLSACSTAHDDSGGGAMPG